MGKLAKPAARLLPEALRSMLGAAAGYDWRRSEPLPRIYPARGARRARVALLAGCVQQVLAPEINWATLEVLAENGVETVIPEGQGCCGALMMHNGEGERARALATAQPEGVPR